MAGSLDMHQIEEWMREAGTIALSHFNRARATFKLDRTPVTQADEEIEAYLSGQISRRYASHGILGEEGTTLAGQEYVWVLDPIDGTRAFVTGLPTWGVALAVLKNNTPLLGMFYMPALGDLYQAQAGGTAYWNEHPLKNTVPATWDDSMSFLAIPSDAHLHYEIDFIRVRALGSTTAHFVYLARGSALGLLTRRVSIWDVVAGLPILESAGGCMRYLSGRRVDLSELLGGRTTPEPIIAGHENLLDRLASAIQPKRP